jgi:hypothetical protein
MSQSPIFRPTAKDDLNREFRLATRMSRAGTRMAAHGVTRAATMAAARKAHFGWH